MMSLRYFELFLEYQLLILEVKLVFEVLGQSKVIFVEAVGFFMFEQDIDVFFSEFIRYLEVTASGNLVSG